MRKVLVIILVMAFFAISLSTGIEANISAERAETVEEKTAILKPKNVKRYKRLFDNRFFGHRAMGHENMCRKNRIEQNKCFTKKDRFGDLF